MSKTFMDIQTKFNIGDDCYYVADHIAKCSEVMNIEIRAHSSGRPTVEIKYNLTGGDCVPEKHLYKTKDELIKSL